MTRLEVILRDWAGSRDPQKQIALVQYGFGKPSDKVEATGLENKTVLRLHFAHEEPGYFDKHPDKRPVGVGGILPEAQFSALLNPGSTTQNNCDFREW